MTRSSVIQLVLIAFLIAIAAAAGWSRQRTHHAADHLLANRRLDGWLAAFGFVGSTTNAWTVMIVSAAAFTAGISAVWLAAGFVGGALLSQLFVAPRLRTMAAGQDCATLTQFINADAGDRMQPALVRSAALIAVVLLTVQVAMIVRVAADLLNMDSGFSTAMMATISVVAVVWCVLVGGVRAATLCDVVQVGGIGIAALLLPVAGLVALGSSEMLMSGLKSVGPTTGDWLAGKSGVVALALVGGALGVAFANPGQPHAMVRLMAVREGRSFTLSRWIAPLLMCLVLAAALVSGWCARVLYDGLQQPHLALYALATRLLPPMLAAIFVAILFAALMLSIASPMLAMASQCAVDLRRSLALLSSGWTRFALAIVALVCLAVALSVPIDPTKHALLPIIGLGAAFSPLLLVRVSGKRVRPGSALGAMWSGFTLAMIFHFLPDSPGDFLEHVLPFVAALGIALSGGERRRNPDRADRAQETVHDRIPI